MIRSLCTQNFCHSIRHKNPVRHSLKSATETVRWLKVTNLIKELTTCRVGLDSELEFGVNSRYSHVHLQRHAPTLGSFAFELYCGQTDTQTRTQTDADERYTPATLVGVSNKIALITAHTAAAKKLYLVILKKRKIKSWILVQIRNPQGAA